MNPFSSIPSLISGPGSNFEEGLASIPLLLGAFEQGRGRPMGNVLSLLGELIGQHAAYRRQGQTAKGLENYVQNILKPGSMAETEFKQFQPFASQVGPDEQIALLQNILGEAQAEAAKKPSSYFNRTTGQTEYHDPNEFAGGIVPKNLIPAGAAANKAQEQALGLPSSEALGQQQIDALALAATGGKMNFRQLTKVNPQLAAKIVDQYRTVGAQTRSDIQYNQFQRERDDKLADAIARSTTTSNEALARFFAEEPTKNKDFESRLEDRLGLTPHGPVETYIMDRYNINPGQLRNLPDDKRKALIDEATAFAAKTAADKTTATTAARIDATAAGAVRTWTSTPIGKSPYFAVDPTTDRLVNDPSMTIGSAANSGLPTIYKTELNAYTQGLEARDTLKSMIPLAQKVLPKAPSTFKNYYTMKAWLEFQAKRGDPDAAAFLAAQAKLIPYLRNMARTSRPNQAEINKILPQISGASNMAQMSAILTDAEGNITSSLKSMQIKGKSDFVRDSSKLRSKAADVGAGITPPASAPSDWTSDDPGASSGKL